MSLPDNGIIYVNNKDNNLINILRIMEYVNQQFQDIFQLQDLHTLKVRY